MEPVGYLVDPIDVTEPSAGDNATPSAEGSVAENVATAAAADAAEATPASASAGTNWGWVWTLVGAMVVGLVLIVLGLRSLRGPAPRSGGRRARLEQQDEVERDYARS